MAASDAWTTIESDPGVFTELIESMGVKSVQVEELYVLEPSSLQRLKPVYGLIFLFKWQPGDKEDKKVVVHDPAIYFASQVITNACATQAMLSILMNMEGKVDIGQELTNLKSFTADFPPELKGITISNADSIRLAHNSFAPPEACIADNELRKATSSDDVYHFVSYIHAGGAVWELDGLQAGPIKHVECTEEDWLEKVCPIISERIAAYSQREIRFNLMAVVKNRKEVLEEELNELLQSMDSDDGTKDAQVQQLRMDIEAEVHKRENWAHENIRRKHNYIPFIFNMLKVLAQKGKLDGLIESAKQKAQTPS